MAQVTHMALRRSILTLVRCGRSSVRGVCEEVDDQRHGRFLEQARNVRVKLVHVLVQECRYVVDHLMTPGTPTLNLYLRETLESSFSVVSKPIFASKY